MLQGNNFVQFLSSNQLLILVTSLTFLISSTLMPTLYSSGSQRYSLRAQGLQPSEGGCCFQVGTCMHVHPHPFPLLFPSQKQSRRAVPHRESQHRAGGSGGSCTGGRLSGAQGADSPVPARHCLVLVQGPVVGDHCYIGHKI